MEINRSGRREIMSSDKIMAGERWEEEGDKERFKGADDGR